MGETKGFEGISCKRLKKLTWFLGCRWKREMQICSSVTTALTSLSVQYLLLLTH